MTYKPDKIRLKCLLIAQTTDWIKNALHQSKRDLRFTISLTDSHNVALIFSCVILVQFKVDCFIRDILIARSEIARGERLVRAQLLFVVGVWWWWGGCTELVGYILLSIVKSLLFVVYRQHSPRRKLRTLSSKTYHSNHHVSYSIVT